MESERVDIVGAIFFGVIFIPTFLGLLGLAEWWFKSETK